MHKLFGILDGAELPALLGLMNRPHNLIHWITGFLVVRSEAAFVKRFSAAAGAGKGVISISVDHIP